MIAAALLAVVVGLALGTLGGGGSVLMVPILLYVAGLDGHAAIATSLFVVFATSLAALVPHMRAGHVRVRVGAAFAGAGLVGAFAGGRLSALIPAPWLLAAFALLMLATSVAMIAGRARTTRAEPSGAARPHLAKLAAEGLAVGLVTGLVGAGGGFVVVPALALLGGLPMSAAVGTSLLVVAVNSLAGFVGHWQDVSLPWGLLVAVTAPAVLGSLAGAKLARRVPEAWLRPMFGWALLAVSLFMLSKQIPADWRESALFAQVFVERWPWWFGGAALAAVVLMFLWYDNKLLGVSTGCAELCRLGREPSVRGSWRLSFLLGIVLGGMGAAFLAGFDIGLSHGTFDRLFSSSLWIKAPVLVGGGLLMGYGARVAGGCTSGHGIVGMAQGARSSVLATVAFMVAGFATTALISSIGSVTP